MSGTVPSGQEATGEASGASDRGAPDPGGPVFFAGVRDQLVQEVLDLEDLVDRLAGATGAADALTGEMLAAASDDDPATVGLRFALDQAWTAAKELRARWTFLLGLARALHCAPGGDKRGGTSP